MNSSEQMKVKVINDYMSLLDLNNPSKIDYKKIENELSIALNEKPAVSFKYDDETTLNEDGKEVKVVNKLKSIEIFYTYADNDGLKFGKQVYIIA